MKISGELIERFFSKKCTVEEARHVAAYLKVNSDELDKKLDLSEWNSIELDDIMPEDFQKEVWQNIESKKKTVELMVWFKKTAIAACFVGVIWVGYFYFPYTNNNTAGKAILSNSIVSKSEPNITSNTSKQIMKVVLQDSSVIHLSPGAVIKYYVPFQIARDIYLSGKALFNVAKDTKPFIVHTGSLTTTALGTVFKITTGEDTPGDNINVILFSGKVVIKSLSTDLRGWGKDVYLLPGQQMQYDATKMFVTVGKIKNIAPVKRPVAKTPNRKLPPVIYDDLIFEGTALPEVIEQLSNYFKVEIEFNRVEIESMNFTGTISKKDSLTNVLKLIGQMNNLDILQKDQGLSIRKITTDSR